MSAMIERNISGLVEALFHSMDQLNAKMIDSEHARALSHTAKTIVAAGHLELEYRRFVAEGDKQPLTSLKIEPPPPPEAP